MFFISAVLIIALACSVISERTLTGYSGVSNPLRILVFLILLTAWTAPLTIGIIRRKMWLSLPTYNLVENIAYFAFGFAFILFVLMFVRDGIWCASYRLFGQSQSWNPFRVVLINRANFITIILTAVIGFYGWRSATGKPQIKELILYSDKINAPFTVLQINDVHIQRSKPVERIRNMVTTANSLKADVIAMPGDILDDVISYITPHIAELSQLKAKYGVYVSAGNHEFYNGIMPTMLQLEQMGFYILSENGQTIANQGIFIAGLPDNPSQRELKEYPQLLEGSQKSDYKILLAHNPSLAKDYLKQGFDLQLSGHTHGGQIFPFHLAVKMVNNYLSGKYNIDGSILYISNGVGYWGPPMRILAKPDMTLIKLLPTPKASD